MVSATDRASVRESGAMTTVTGHSPAPRVATRSGSSAKSGSRRMNAVAQSLSGQRLFVRALDEMEDLDRLQLCMRGLLCDGIDRVLPVVRMQLQRAGMETPWRDAPALELQKETQSRSKQLVEVVDAQRCERVWVQRRSLAAAQPGHQSLFEQPLSRLVEHAQLARRTHQVRELVEQARADAVKSPDPGTIEDFGPEIRPARTQLFGDPRAQLIGGAIIEGDGKDRARGHAVLDQPAETLRRGGGLASARSGRDQARAFGPGVRGRRLPGTP